MIPNTRLDELAAMEKAATDAPWSSGLPLGELSDVDPSKLWHKSQYIGRIDSPWDSHEKHGINAAFIAAARNEFAAMIEQCREANRLREAMRATFEAKTVGAVFKIIFDALKETDS